MLLVRIPNCLILTLCWHALIWSSSWMTKSFRFIKNSYLAEADTSKLTRLKPRVTTSSKIFYVCFAYTMHVESSSVYETWVPNSKVEMNLNGDWGLPVDGSSHGR